jgi:hypothetical protein
MQNVKKNTLGSREEGCTCSLRSVLDPRSWLGARMRLVAGRRCGSVLEQVAVTRDQNNDASEGRMEGFMKVVLLTQVDT